MRRSSLELLRCPRCLHGALTADGDVPQVHFGPVRCSACGATYPVSEGVLDLLLPDPGHRDSLLQQVLGKPLVARNYERGVRTALQLLGAHTRLDEKSEILLVRSLLQPTPGEPLLDLSAGTAVHARRLAVLPGAGPVIAMDRSPAMLEEALHHQREDGVPLDLVRADAARVPLRSGTMGRVLSFAAFHLYEDPRAVLAEVSRVLKPGGAFVCSSLLPERVKLVDRLEARAGVLRHGEDELQDLCTSAGLVGFERILAPPVVLFRVEKPATAAL